MATTTTNLGLTKPALSESADVTVLNDNWDKVDTEAGKERSNLAAAYNASSAYAVGAYCTRGGNVYRCTTAIGSSGEAWNAAHWTQVTVTGEIPKVINNLTSTSTSDALSAKQGKELSDQIGDISTLLSNEFPKRTTTISNLNCYGVTGIVTGSGKNAQIYIPLNMDDNARVGTITSLTCSLRLSTGGFFGGSDSINLSSYITSVTLRRLQSIIVVELTKNDGFGATNNTTFGGIVNITGTITAS